MDKKPILLIDFDGVCHSYGSGWLGAAIIPDPPVPGLFEFLYAAHEHFELHIYSSRSNQVYGITAMRNWFALHWRLWADRKPVELPPTEIVGELRFPTDKPNAFMTIDDRGYRFTGVWPDPAALLGMHPWNKPSAAPAAPAKAHSAAKRAKKAPKARRQRANAANSSPATPRKGRPRPTTA